MIKFGTGGFRAIIGDEFTKNNVEQLARAVARKMKVEEVKEKTIVLGYDRRFLSREASQWAAGVFAQEGIKVLLIDKPVPTPMIMFEVKRLNLDYGMAVTASHNPALYNGVNITNLLVNVYIHIHTRLKRLSPHACTYILHWPKSLSFSVT